MFRFFQAAAVVGMAASFCEDGVQLGVDSHVAAGAKVVITWAQAPLLSTSAAVGQKAKYLSLYHTALVFRQDIGKNDSKYWTLEFDAANEIVDGIVPSIVDGGLKWSGDARWCLRDGIFNGRAHWTQNFVDVATISGDQFQDIMSNYVPQFNASVPGAWPQYQLFRVQDAVGQNIFADDTTCDHVYRVIQYVRDTLKVPVKDMVFEATRVTVPCMGVKEVDMSNKEEKDSVTAYYKNLRDATLAGKTGVSNNLGALFKALFQFTTPVSYVYDSNYPGGGRYLRLLFAAPGAVSLLFYTKYEAIGDLPAPPATNCDVGAQCVEAMGMCTRGAGSSCRACLADQAASLISGGCHSDAIARAQDVNCYCGSQCDVASECLEAMTQNCQRGGGDSCLQCMVWAYPKVALLGPCQLGPVKTTMSRDCFCDADQWSPRVAETVFA